MEKGDKADNTKQRTSARFQICVCDGPSCGVTYESDVLKEQLARKIAADPDLVGRVSLINYDCFGRCDEGPNLFVETLAEGQKPGEEPEIDVMMKQRGFYPSMDAEKCERVLREHCGAGKPVEDLVDEY